MLFEMNVTLFIHICAICRATKITTKVCLWYAYEKTKRIEKNKNKKMKRNLKVCHEDFVLNRNEEMLLGLKDLNLILILNLSYDVLNNLLKFNMI